MTSSEVLIRPRRSDDFAELGRVLFAQQLETRYPFRNPLPVPVERFLHEHNAVCAWSAELDGRLVGHVCRTGAAHGFPDAAMLNEVCATAHGCEPSEVSWVSSLFVAHDARGLGVGRRLLETVVADIRADGMHPCLEVLPFHPAALGLYRASGWRTVHSFRPDWLRADMGGEGPDVQVMVHRATDGSAPTG